MSDSTLPSDHIVYFHFQCVPYISKRVIVMHRCCLVQVESFYPSVGSQVLLVAQFKRLFLLFLPIVPSEQTEALPAAQKPANSLQRHSNEVKCVVFCSYPGRGDLRFTVRSWPKASRDTGHPLHRYPPRRTKGGSSVLPLKYEKS